MKNAARVKLLLSGSQSLYTFSCRNHPLIQSNAELDGEHIERYLIYLNTEDSERKGYRTDLIQLKSQLDLIGRMSNDVLAMETKEMRQSMDEILRKIIKR